MVNVYIRGFMYILEDIEAILVVTLQRIKEFLDEPSMYTCNISRGILNA